MNTIANRVQVLSQFDRNIKFNLIKIVGRGTNRTAVAVTSHDLEKNQ